LYIKYRFSLSYCGNLFSVAMITQILCVTRKPAMANYFANNNKQCYRTTVVWSGQVDNTRHNLCKNKQRIPELSVGENSESDDFRVIKKSCVSSLVLESATIRLPLNPV